MPSAPNGYIKNMCSFFCFLSKYKLEEEDGGEGSRWIIYCLIKISTFYFLTKNVMFININIPIIVNELEYLLKNTF